MAQGKKSRQEDKAKIVELKINDPQLSLRDIAKETWLWKDTVNKTINEIPEQLKTSSDNGDIIINKLDKTIDMIQQVIENNVHRLLEENEQLKAKDMKALSDIQKQNFERKQILTWKPTDIKQIELDIEWKSMRELEDIRKELLG